MTDVSAFTKLVPGFEFLQGLVKNAGAALPGIGQWVAPTLDPAELEKRIEELRTVQFWLEQNARMLGATIQALEVQRMTLSTLKTMNVQMDDLRESMQIRMPSAAPAGEASTAAKAMPGFTWAAASAPAAAAEGSGEATPAAPTVPAAGVVDPMQWWGALTKQFTDLATHAMKDTADGAARTLAGARRADDASAPPPPEASAAGRPRAARKSPARKAARKTVGQR